MINGEDEWTFGYGKGDGEDEDDYSWGVAYHKIMLFHVGIPLGLTWRLWFKYKIPAREILKSLVIGVFFTLCGRVRPEGRIIPSYCCYPTDAADNSNVGKLRLLQLLDKARVCSHTRGRMLNALFIHPVVKTI